MQNGALFSGFIEPTAKNTFFVCKSPLISYKLIRQTILWKTALSAIENGDETIMSLQPDQGKSVTLVLPAAVNYFSAA
ncbi:MAG: hypothetical protein C0523_04005 [Cytophaga sp.]|nr:hypothetical protein [Cytophaga sp.]